MDMKSMLSKMTTLSDGGKVQSSKKTITEGTVPARGKLTTKLSDIIAENEQLTIAPAQQNTQVIKQGQKTLGTVTNPQLASQLKTAIGKGEMSFNADELTEEDLEEVAAPGQEKWINSNKKRFIDKYGEEKGLSNLYATAWRRHHSKNSSKKIDEVSSETLGRYKKAASADASKADKEGDFKKGDKRYAGIIKATTKQFANDAKKHKKLEESIELEEADDTFNHILKKFKYEVQKFQTGAHQMDPDLFDAVFDYYQHAGKMPYSVAKGRGTHETREWLNDQFEHDLIGAGIDMVGSPRQFDDMEDDMFSNPFEKDVQFESWDRQLKTLLSEGLTISSSTGNQNGLEDSITISATGSDSEEITAMLRSAGIGHFGAVDPETTTGSYGAPESVESGSGGFAVEIEDGTPSSGGTDIRDFLKKFSDMEQSGPDGYTDESVQSHEEDEETTEEDVVDSENGDEAEHDPSCDDCGLVETECECKEEPLEETYANSADETNTQSIDYMTNTISGGLNSQKVQHKHGYRNGDNPMAMKESSDSLRQWIKLSGL